jgi:chaperonin GroEL
MAFSQAALSALPLSDRTFRKKPSSSSSSSPNFVLRVRAAAKEVHFNRDGSVTKKLQAGADMVAKLLGVTLGPKGRNVVLQNKYGPPRIVNDGETVLKEVSHLRTFYCDTLL